MKDDMVTMKAIRAHQLALITKRDDALNKLAKAGLSNDIERFLRDALYRSYEPQIHALQQRFVVAEYWETKEAGDGSNEQG